MTFHIFVTTPRAGFPGVVTPYTVELKESFATREEAQAFADGKSLSAGAKALLDAMPSAYPAWSATFGTYVAGASAHFVADAGFTWRCNQTHSAQVDRRPSALGIAGVLWLKVQPPGFGAWDFPVWYELSSPAPRCTFGGRAHELIQPHNSEGVHRQPNAVGIANVLWRDVGLASIVQPYPRARFDVVSSEDPDYTQVERAKEV